MEEARASWLHGAVVPPFIDKQYHGHDLFGECGGSNKGFTHGGGHQFGKNYETYPANAPLSPEMV